MSRAPRRRDLPLLTNVLLARIAGAGAFSAVAALLLILYAPGDFEHRRWLAYTALVVAQCVRAYANRSLRTPVHSLPPNGFLALACLAAVAIQALIPYVPLLAETFRAVPLDPTDWLLVIVVALLPALVAELVRTWRHAEWVA